MLDRIKPCNDNRIIENFIKTFISEIDFRSYAIQNPSARIYASDFLIEPNKESFSDIFTRISSKQNKTFYITWMFSTIYKDTFSDTINIGIITKDDLIKLLLKQKEEMVNNCLVYIKNLSLTDFWDLMIFDESVSWSCVLTHEDDFDDKRICYYVKSNQTDKTNNDKKS